MNNIKKIRKSQKISVTQLAQMLNMSQSNLTKIENNQLELKRQTATQIAQILNVSLDAIYNTHKEEGSNIINPETFNLPNLSTFNLIPEALKQNNNIYTYICQDDTMSPSINKNSIVLIDTNKKDIENGIFLIKINNITALRRLQTTHNNTVNILTDNRFYPAIETTFSQLNIIGQAIYCYNFTNI